jgi:hypothetical protein
MENIHICVHTLKDTLHLGRNMSDLSIETKQNSFFKPLLPIIAHMAFLTNLVSQPSLDISFIWIPLISNEDTNSKGSL